MLVIHSCSQHQALLRVRGGAQGKYLIDAFRGFNELMESISPCPGVSVGSAPYKNDGIGDGE